MAIALEVISAGLLSRKGMRNRMQRHASPAYKTAARSILHERIAKLETMKISFQEDLQKVWAQQIDALDPFLNPNCDLPRLLKKARRWNCAATREMNVDSWKIGNPKRDCSRFGNSSIV